MKLIKTALFSGVSTFIKIAASFVVGKVVAIYTGPSGVAIIGAFTNFVTVMLTFANGAINTGVVKYTAEYENNPSLLKPLFSTALKISIYCSSFIGLLLLFFAPFLSSLILTSTLYINAIRLFGLTIVLYSLNTLLVSILNGKGQIRSFTLVNIIGSLVGLVLTTVLIYFYQLQGALYALVLVQSIVFFVTFGLIIKSDWFSWDFFRQSFDKEIAIKLGHYSLMAIVSALVVPTSQILLRNMLISKIDINAAGYWQGMMRVSDGYLLIITTGLSTYYLPKLSSLKADSEIKKEIFQGFKIILPCVFIGCIIIYLIRFFIIRTLYTPDFYFMEQLFFWQLIGDFLKIASYILAYLMLAKAMTKVFIINEILLSVSYVVLSYFFVDIFGLKGITIAFALNYFFSLIVMIILFRKLLLKTNTH